MPIWTEEQWFVWQRLIANNFSDVTITEPIQIPYLHEYPAVVVVMLLLFVLLSVSPKWRIMKKEKDQKTQNQEWWSFVSKYQRYDTLNALSLLDK